MSYKWNNEKKLISLDCEGKEGVLNFTTESEKAIVYLNEGDIEKVIYKCSGEETVITKKDRFHIVVGEGNSQRDVYHYLKPKGPAPQMRLGITKHNGRGTWSSLPHDFELNTEPGFEEIFFYILEGGTQKAIQRGEGVWYDNSPVNDCWLVKNKTFGMVPMGYHPIVGEPDVSVSYVWVYICKKPEWEKI